jgi:hypothetical protein
MKFAAYDDISIYGIWRQRDIPVSGRAIPRSRIKIACNLWV